MKKILILSTALYSLIFSSFLLAAPATESKESKDAKTLQELNYKYERLIQLDYARHQEVMRQLREIKELAKKPNTPAEMPTASATAAATPVVIEAPATPSTPAVTAPAVTEPEAKAPEKQAEVAAAATTPAASSAEPVAGTSATPALAQPSAPEEAAGREIAAAPATPEAVAPVAAVTTTAATPPPAAAPEVKEVKAVIPPELLQGIHESESYAILAILFSIVSLGGMGVLIYTVRKSDARIRRMLWKSEVDHLRDEVMGGRPMLKVEKSYDRLLLTNTGTVIADDIKLSLGPAPATMKQRLRVLTKIAAGEKAEVEIGAQADGQIYGTLEYKNPENDRIYKEQFTLKVDAVTGEFAPVQQVG